MEQINISAFLGWIPNLIAALIVLIIGYVVSRILKNTSYSLLGNIELDKKLYESPAENMVKKITDSPSRLIAKFIYWVLMVIVITLAIAALNVPVLNTVVEGIYSYLPNILAAILIFGIAISLSAALSTLIMRLMGDTATGKIAATTIPIILIGIAIFMILEQLQIAPNVVIITYAALIGSVALGFAVAFGLGGRNVAEKILEESYERGRLQINQAKKDIQKGKERGEGEARKKFNK
jgi:hypothetical protein